MQHVPGKVIVIGEHAVLHGQPAIATPVPLRLTLSATLAADRGYPGDPRLRTALATAAAFFGLDPRHIRLRIVSQLPVGGGLGSSAALSVALVRALAQLREVDVDPGELLRMATEVEHGFHGRSSGLDIHAVASDRLIWFEPGPKPSVSPLAVSGPFDFVVGLSGQRRSTAAKVGAPAPGYPPDGDCPAGMRRLGDLTHQARTALIRGDTMALGQAMNTAHEELRALGVSTPVLDRMVDLTRTAGAVGAKLTGAGHGGAVIALTPGRTREALLALRAAGYDAFALTASRPDGA